VHVRACCACHVRASRRVRALRARVAHVTPAGRPATRPCSKPARLPACSPPARPLPARTPPARCAYRTARPRAARHAVCHQPRARSACWPPPAHCAQPPVPLGTPPRPPTRPKNATATAETQRTHGGFARRSQVPLSANTQYCKHHVFADVRHPDTGTSDPSECRTHRHLCRQERTTRMAPPCMALRAQASRNLLTACRTECRKASAAMLNRRFRGIGRCAPGMRLARVQHAGAWVPAGREADQDVRTICLEILRDGRVAAPLHPRAARVMGAASLDSHPGPRLRIRVSSMADRSTARSHLGKA
jgi:hypothetical protein